MASRILNWRAVTFGLAGALCMPSILRAQTNYPDKPITDGYTIQIGQEWP